MLHLSNVVSMITMPKISITYGGALIFSDLHIIHCFLLLKFEDVRPEEWTPSYAGQSSRMDFLLKDEGIVIESKMTRQGHGNKEIANELLVDISRYKESDDCKILICFIYDKDSIIENRKGFIYDLEKNSSVDFKVRVFINP